jgi:hypothetical protein
MISCAISASKRKKERQHVNASSGQCYINKKQSNMNLLNSGELSELYSDAMKIKNKGHDALTQMIIEHIFKTETYNSYLHDSERWYVSKYNAAHYIHYRFIYKERTVTLKYFIHPDYVKPQFIPFA